MLPSFKDYCAQIARLPDQFPAIVSSTLTAYTIGPFAAEVVRATDLRRGLRAHCVGAALPFLIREVEQLLKL